MSKSKPAKTMKKPTNEQNGLPKRKNEGPLTLAPLEFEEALRGLLDTPPPPKEDKEPAKKRSEDKTTEE